MNIEQGISNVEVKISLRHSEFCTRYSIFAFLTNSKGFPGFADH
jgi:hypothetical protein